VRFDRITLATVTRIQIFIAGTPFIRKSSMLNSAFSDAKDREEIVQIAFQQENAAIDYARL